MRYALFASGLFLVFTPPAEAQLFRRLFGGRQQVQVQQNACYQQPVYYAPNYTQTYTQNYQAVAAIPLAAIPVAVDLQAYQYAVNATAFQSFRDYQAQKVAAQAQPEATQVAQQAPVGVVGTNIGEAPTGAVVLKQNCFKCHQAGNSPKAGLALFDAKGDLYGNLPLADIMERITAEEPAARMPPGKTLAPHDATAVLRLASSVLLAPTERVAATETPKSRNPFE